MSTEEFEPTTTRTPGRKQRMGASAPTPETPASRPAQTVPAAAPVRLQRMGRPAAAASSIPGGTPATRQRMGAPARAPEEEASATATGMGGSSVPAEAAPAPAARSRMGEAGPRETPAPAAVDTAAKPKSLAGSWRTIAVRAIGAAVLAVVVVLSARWLRGVEEVQDFLLSYPGHMTLPDSAPEGIPAWMGWQHFLNMFFIVLIIRTGLLIRTEKRPPGYWQAKKRSFFSPHNGEVKKISLSQWLHQALDVLWVVNGVVFIILLAVTGHWMRIVPTSWDILPNMASTALQYASLQWPEENGWIHYNALQMLAYFLTVYIAAPLAIISGVRMSTWWPANAGKLDKWYPIEVARALHFPVMLYFVAFTIVHVFLVFFTGALRNLNHMYTSRDEVDFWGLGIFFVSVVIIVAGWFLAKPMFTTPVAAATGTVTKN